MTEKLIGIAGPQCRFMHCLPAFPDLNTEIGAAIYEKCHHGATIMDAEGSHAHKGYKMVYSVISGEDSKKAMQAIKEIDPDAFVNSIRTTELKGNFYIRPRD